MTTVLNPGMVARALGGQVTGPDTVQAPGPGHSPRDRSLSVRLDAAAPDGYLVHSHAGDDWRTCRDHVRARLHLPWDSARPAIKQSKRRLSCVVADEPTHAERTRGASAIWAGARELPGTPAWTYLRRRGVDLRALPEDLEEVLRWDPCCPWKCGHHGCLIALWTDTHTGEPRAIHRRPLTPAGESVAHWRAQGPTAGCVIRLWPDSLVTHGLVIGEGIETALAAATRIAHRGTLLQPAWAAGDAGHLAKFPVLPGIEALTLLVDHDKKGGGQRATAECAGRWTAAGREVIRLTPRIVGQDFANVVRDSR